MSKVFYKSLNNSPRKLLPLSVVMHFEIPNSENYLMYIACVTLSAFIPGNDIASDHHVHLSLMSRRIYVRCYLIIISSSTYVYMISVKFNSCGLSNVNNINLI